MPSNRELAKLYDVNRGAIADKGDQGEDAFRQAMGEPPASREPAPPVAPPVEEGAEAEPELETEREPGQGGLAE